MYYPMEKDGWKRLADKQAALVRQMVGWLVRIELIQSEHPNF